MANLCPIHNLEFRLVPAGVSQRTGKSYPAFYVCDVRGCKEKPVELKTDEPIDQAIAQGPQAQDIPSAAIEFMELLNAQTESKKRSYRIERQHSQNMAILFLDLWSKLQVENIGIDEIELWKRVIELTDKFVEDLNEKEKK